MRDFVCGRLVNKIGAHHAVVKLAPEDAVKWVASMRYELYATRMDLEFARARLALLEAKK